MSNNSNNNNETIQVSDIVSESDCVRTFSALGPITALSSSARRNFQQRSMRHNISSNWIQLGNSVGSECLLEPSDEKMKI